jgi:hypothetical protein
VLIGLPAIILIFTLFFGFFQIQKQWRIRRAINTRDTKINNLDLDNDNQVDHISVVSYDEAQWYCIARSSGSTSQDVAVVEVNKQFRWEDCVQVTLGMRLARRNCVEPSYNRTET